MTLDPERVETPIGRVDLARTRANARAVAEYAGRHGLRWRPHIKTHKSRRIARIQLDEGARGLTVATPREAEVMAALTSDLLLAYPPVGEDKVRRVTRLARRVDLKVALDDRAVLLPLAAAARGEGATVGVLVEMDVGLGRVGVASADEVVALARLAADTSGVAFRGVQFYPGHIRTASGVQTEALAQVAGEVRRTLDALAQAGLTPEIVSGGSTPTLWRSHEIPGVTEIRSGSCIFFDREALAVGVADPEQVAYTVLTTVVSTAVSGRAVVDAGSKALSKEERGGDEGYGFVLEHPEVRVRALSEEHGVLDLTRSDWRPTVGDRVHLVPNHVCVSVNLQDRLLGYTPATDGDAAVSADATPGEQGQYEWISLEARGRGPWSD